MAISIETMTIDCAVRHIRTLFYQCSEDRKADFGETCSQCPHMPECNCDWINTLPTHAGRVCMEYSRAQSLWIPVMASRKQ